MSKIKEHRYAILLMVLILSAVAESFGGALLGGPIAVDILAAIGLLAVLLVVFERRGERYISLAMVTVAIAATLTHGIDMPGTLQTGVSVAYHAAQVLFFGFAVVVILRSIFQQTRIRTDDVLGALCGYLLAGAAWANAYVVNYIVSPESFSIAAALSDRVADWHGRNALFYLISLGNLTTIGYGDVTAVKPPATILSMLEAVFGQFYIAVVVAQLVGLRMAHAPGRH
jgi:hypothetical protein